MPSGPTAPVGLFQDRRHILSQARACCSKRPAAQPHLKKAIEVKSSMVKLAQASSLLQFALDAGTGHTSTSTLRATASWSCHRRIYIRVYHHSGVGRQDASGRQVGSNKAAVAEGVQFLLLFDVRSETCPNTLAAEIPTCV